MDDCIFCKIINGDIPCTKVYETDRVLAFADINPIADGHTLVIPKAHAENIWEISEEDLSAIHLAAKRVANGMRVALNPNGVAALQLNGGGVGQVVMHYHLHLVPRPEGSPALPISHWDLKPGDMSKIQEIAGKITANIK
jgi:histidine triad (HIT) family protein